MYVTAGTTPFCVCASGVVNITVVNNGATMPIDSLKDVYLRLSDAEHNGANITSAVHDLNQALQLIESGDPSNISQAIGIIQNVNASIPSLVAQGEATTIWGMTKLIVTVASLIIVAILVFLFLPRFVWQIWLKMKKDWMVSVQ